MRKVLSLLILMLLLSACANGDRYNFSGSSDHWDVFFTADVSDESSQSITGTIKYTGEEPVPKTIDYTFKRDGGNLEGRDLMVEEDAVNIGKLSCEDCAVTQEDDQMEVEITWNGQSENLRLSNDR
ncbi:hypothetical protein P6709_06925 [Jeotgalibacillus sp. ET6]|uniref:hypothetical protein n=1 Tax=Jeotgalibacillus sp. ET6 TaxID=3037260 RepID=UPI0024185745|nr:hypothetical protein [Jeotgalibacillus sp. ET6]MDG5471475.1 hypothetical protein [Jeotgalibacillus sp. ET6]